MLPPDVWDRKAVSDHGRRVVPRPVRRARAVGQFIRSAEEKPGTWSVVDVLHDQLAPLGVPVLGGLPIGHGPYPATVPLGTVATLDTTTRTLTIEPGVC